MSWDEVNFISSGYIAYQSIKLRLYRSVLKIFATNNLLYENWIVLYLWKNESPSTKDTCNFIKFDWSWRSGSGEEGKNVNSLWTDGTDGTDGRTDRRRAIRFLSFQLRWAKTRLKCIDWTWLKQSEVWGTTVRMYRVDWFTSDSFRIRNKC